MYMNVRLWWRRLLPWYKRLSRSYRKRIDGQDWIEKKNINLKSRAISRELGDQVQW